MVKLEKFSNFPKNIKSKKPKIFRCAIFRWVEVPVQADWGFPKFSTTEGVFVLPPCTSFLILLLFIYARHMQGI